MPAAKGRAGTPLGPKEKIPKIAATFVYASSQGQRTHSARTNFCTSQFPSSQVKMRGVHCAALSSFQVAKHLLFIHSLLKGKVVTKL
jgi:hypothetical protein